jgi:hypothetical protein
VTADELLAAAPTGTPPSILRQNYLAHLPLAKVKSKGAWARLVTSRPTTPSRPHERFARGTETHSCLPRDRQPSGESSDLLAPRFP